MMNKLLIAVAMTAALSACAADPAADKTKAAVTAASSSAPTARTTKGEAVAIKPETSKIEFVGSKVTGKHDGSFKDFSGTIDLVNNKAEESQVAIDIQMKSVETDAAGLTKHLQNADFFDVEKHPKASFVSTKIAPDTAKGENMYSVTGDFEIRGVKKSITFPAKIVVSPTEVAVDSDFAINRKDFGIAYAGKADDLIRDDVAMKLNLRAARGK